MAAPKRYWFKTHKYGFGWYPATWQGWVIFMLYMLTLIFYFNKMDENSHSVSDTLIGIVPYFLIATLILIFICARTSEERSVVKRKG